MCAIRYNIIIFYPFGVFVYFHFIPLQPPLNIFLFFSLFLFSADTELSRRNIARLCYIFEHGAETKKTLGIYLWLVDFDDCGWWCFSIVVIAQEICWRYERCRVSKLELQKLSLLMRYLAAVALHPFCQKHACGTYSPLDYHIWFWQKALWYMHYRLKSVRIPLKVM